MVGQDGVEPTITLPLRPAPETRTLPSARGGLGRRGDPEIGRFACSFSDCFAALAMKKSRAGMLRRKGFGALPVSRPASPRLSSGNLQTPARPAKNSKQRGHVVPKDGEHLAMLAGLQARVPQVWRIILKLRPAPENLISPGRVLPMRFQPWRG
jgi:hypothetical protein